MKKKEVIEIIKDHLIIFEDYSTEYQLNNIANGIYEDIKELLQVKRRSEG